MIRHLKLTSILLLIFLFIQSASNAQNRRDGRKLYKSSYNFEATCIATGVEGVKILMVWVEEKKLAIAKVEVEKDAVAACIFKGAKGYDEVPPIITETDADIKYEEYFDDFFKTGGKYLQFIAASTEVDPGNIIRKGKKLVRVGAKIAVDYDALRKQLEADGIIRSIKAVASEIKMPTIMIMPSDIYCNKHGYTIEFDDMSTVKTVADYKKAMQNDEALRLVIAKIQEMYATRGYPVKDLEQELKSLEQENAEMAMMMSKTSGATIAESPVDILKRTAKADILLDLDFSVETQGPKKYITFNLRGLDAYTSKVISSTAGTGEPSLTAQPELLLEEAVLAYIDKFNAQIMAHFKDIVENGREVEIMVRVWDTAPVDLEELFYIDGEDLELLELIDFWMEDNTVNGMFSNADNSENFIKYEQVRIPLTYERRGKIRDMDTRRYVSNLRSYLSHEPFNLECKIYQRGLGEAWLIIGEK